MKKLKRFLALALVLCMVLSAVPFGTSAIEITSKPADGSTDGQPFTSGTGGSTNFRIPALVTLSDGTLVAAADARWNTTYDGGGLDTIVALSFDKGATWNYTFANYLGDNGNTYNGSSSTAFIDPALAVDDDDTIYMLCDLYPYGVALSGSGNKKPSNDVGFNSDGKLLLSTDGSDYSYYLDGTVIKDSSGNTVPGYTVDPYFNITGNGTNTNLFFSDSPYKVVRTGYLYLTKSTDKGATWSAPTLIPNVKTTSEQVCLVGPGKGLVTSDDGTIIFPVYSYKSNEFLGVTVSTTEAASFIYSTDGGATWSRTANATTSMSSEGQLVQLDEDTLRMFFRNETGYICYVDATGTGATGYTWGTVVQTSVSVDSDCQLSAIKYSETVDGKTAILLSCPGESDRVSGKVFTFLLDDSYNMTLAYTLEMGSGTYQYSCLSELKDGAVGLLYENGAASITYVSGGMDVIAPGAQIGEATVTPGFVENSTIITSLNLQVGTGSKTVSFQGLADGQSITVSSSDTAVADVSVDGINVTVTPVAEGTATITATVQSTARAAKAGDTYQLSVTVAAAAETPETPETPAVTVDTDIVSGTNSNATEGSGKAVNRVMTSVGVTYDLDLLNQTAFPEGCTVTWSSDNAAVTVDANGAVKGITVGAANVTATVTDTSGNVLFTDTVEVYVIAGSGSASGRLVSFYIDEITNSRVYMSMDASASLIEMYEGDVIYLYMLKATRPNNYSKWTYNQFAFTFFAAPKDDYALTRMSSTNSKSQYYALEKNVSAADTSFYSAEPCKNLRAAFDDTSVQNMIQAAIDNKCDGAMGWTRYKKNVDSFFGNYADPNQDDITSTLTFRSEKLPTVDKKIVSVNDQPYVEGMTAKEGDVIVYNVSVTQYAASDDITYSNAALTDKLEGAVFTSSGTNTLTLTLSNDAIPADKTVSYEVKYTIEKDDLDTLITNTVDLTYTYQSKYSSGSFSGSADAEASITASSYTPPTNLSGFVVDFGLTATFKIGGWGKYDVVSATAKYADVTVTGDHTNGYTITYTPNKVMQGVDTVTMVNSKGGEFTFNVYPATTVFYEEGFAEFISADVNSPWTTGSKGTGTQNNDDAYGFDDKYSAETGMSNGTEAISTNSGDKAVFTFTGTGVDVYMNCSSASGRITVRIDQVDAQGNKTLKKFYQIDTKTGYGGADVCNSLPVVSLTGLDYANYTVTITHVNRSAGVVGGSIALDGFRVYGTIVEAEGSNSIYYPAKEDHPVYYEIRDMVLTALKVTDSTTVDQVFEAIDTGAVAVVLDNTTATIQDLLDNGPKNELFLFAGQTLTFKVTTSRAMQIGLKAPCGATGYTVAVGDEPVKSGTISTSTDMFYALGNTTGTEETYTITITNSGSNILSVTDLKICDDPNAAFEALTSEDIELALKVMRSSNITYADATLNINLVDYAGNVLAGTTLTANGAAGEVSGFSAADILTAVDGVLPAGYAVVDAAAVEEQPVVNGETGSVTIQVGKTATLNVTYRKLLGGKAVGYATLTAVQTSQSRWAVFTGADIQALAPGGYRPVLVISVPVSYGNTASVIILVR